ncbi:aminoacylase-1-like [Photinus pyralis]|uniref:aminoacylase-1-like n=1 Tax=Photinus pyralis TaxID=7054 RepID=UPI001266EE53|nr:aminoacylase-1-like [Photinus pyralis]
MDLKKVAVENLQKYLRIPTVHPNVNYGPAVKFLESLAGELGLPVKVLEYHPSNPIVLISWVGEQPNLPSILLNSHMDTVPVNEKKWAHNPFGAEIDEYGNIHGRGAQDCKGIGMIYIETIRRLKQAGVQLKRTVHVLFVPDEELGGTKGMGAFTGTKEFKELNVGFAIDEGFGDVGNKFLASYADRLGRKMVIHCEGTAGHGSLLLHNTAGEKLAKVLTKFYNERRQQKEKLSIGKLGLGEVTSINLTKMEGGLSSNIIPQKLSATIDCRVTPKDNVGEFEDMINRWCREAGDGVTVEYLHKSESAPATALNDSNPYWVAFEETVTQLGIPLETWIYPASTDAIHLRAVGVSTIGFVPFRYTPFLKHADNESLNVNTFLEAIDVYTKILPQLANV